MTDADVCVFSYGHIINNTETSMCKRVTNSCLYKDLSDRKGYSIRLDLGLIECNHIVGKQSSLNQKYSRNKKVKIFTILKWHFG